MSNLVITLVKHHLNESDAPFTLALILADAARDDGSALFLSVPTLAKFSRQSERTVQNQLKKMVKSGWLIQVSISKGPGYANGYRINPVWIEEATLRHEEYLATREAERKNKAFHKKGLWIPLGISKDDSESEKQNNEMGAHHENTGEKESMMGEELLRTIPYIDHVFLDNTTPTKIDLRRVFNLENELNWKPSELFRRDLKKNKVSDHIFTTERVAEFNSYWRSHPEIQTNHAGWEHKFLQRLKFIQNLDDQLHGAEFHQADMPKSPSRDFQ
jgi:hypothetical protein